MQLLAGHIIKLNGGRLAESSASALKAMFEEHVPAWQRLHREQPLRFVLYVPSGLLSEDATIRRARRHIEWWKANGVYPIVLHWRSGLLDEVAALLQGSRRRALATPAIDGALDLMTERLVRAEGVAFWAAVKREAELAVQPQVGGAWLLSRKLAPFGIRHSAPVHAAAHSAGAILLAHLIPCALDAGLGSFRTVQLLGPAVRADLVSTLLGRGIGELTVFALEKAAERKDRISRLYHKSLLYLISHAFEPTYNVPLLGLAESFPANAVLSAAGSHAGLDDDPEIMNALLKRMLERRDPPYCPYQQEHWNRHDHSQREQDEHEERPIAA